MSSPKLAHEPTVLLLTSGVGGMVLGFGVYKFTHFAPAILLFTIASVLLTLFATGLQSR